MRISFHGFTATGLVVHIFDEAQVERASTVLISLKLGDGGLGSLSSVEFNHATTTRTAARLVLDLCLFNLADGGEELDEIVIASGPGELVYPSACFFVQFSVQLTLRT